MNTLRVFDVLTQLYQNPLTQKTFCISGKENGVWREYYLEEYINNVNEVSLGLMAMGLKKGDKIATICNNRPEWNFIEHGAAQIGVVHVPIHPTLVLSDFLYILNHSESKVLIVSDNNLYQSLSGAKEQLNFVEHIFTFNTGENLPHWSAITQKADKTQIPELEKIKASILPDDLLTLIYTSGTTGISKGVMLSHTNLLSNAKSSSKFLHLDHRHRALSFLPLSHIFEHMVNYMWHFSGVSIYYAENLSTIAKDMNELQVDGFITVPRLLESVFEKILNKAKSLSPIKKMIFRWALQVGNRYDPYAYRNPFYRLSHFIVDVLVFKKWRQALSMNIKFIGCGGAALQPRLARLFWAAGLPVFEGYGLTETSPILSVNYWKKDGLRLGSVGPVLEGVEVKIAGDGEILAKGPNLMLGYYKDEANTKDVLDEEGWFHTGDIGDLIDGRFLRITDRKKEIFKMSNGKYISPQQIENKLKESFYVQQIMVVGENQKFASAIILPNFSQLNDWCKKQGIHASSQLELIKVPQVIKHFEHEIKKINKHLGSFEQIKKIALVADEWSPLTGELSPSLKLKRKVILEKYRKLVDNIYTSKVQQTQSIHVDKK